MKMCIMLQQYLIEHAYISNINKCKLNKNRENVRGNVREVGGGGGVCVVVLLVS